MKTVGVKNYEQFDPGFQNQNQAYDSAKLAYLRKNTLPLLQPLGRDAAILEIGPGQGALLHLLGQLGFQNAVGFEVCEAYATRLNAQGFRVAYGSSAQEFLSTKEKHFDAIVLIDVLEHLERDDAYALIQSCYAALKPAGKLILQLPNMSGLFGGNTFFADFTHRTGYNELSLRALLLAAGFKEQRVDLLPLRLPDSPANLIRTGIRNIIFSMARVLTRVVGSTPIRVLTHNMIAVAVKHESAT